MREPLSSKSLRRSLSSNFAWAWDNVSGTIRGINADAHQITLDDGEIHSLQAGVGLASLKIGDKVTASVEVQDGKNVVNKVTKS